VGGVNEVDLRPATDADAPFLFELCALTRAEEWAALPDETRAAILRMQFTAQHRDYRARHPGAIDAIVLVGGEPAGRLYVDRTCDPIVILDVRLAPSAAGAGRGGALLRALLAEAAGAGRAVRLHVARTNRARRLYERLGFRSCGGDEVYEAMEWRAGEPAPRMG